MASFWDQPLSEPWRRVPLLRDRHGVEWEQDAMQRDPAKVRERVEQAVDHWTDRARSIPYLSTLGAPMPRPRVVYDLKGHIAGMAVSTRRHPARCEQWTRLHPELLLRYPVRMIQQTIPHEMAHLVVDWYLPKVDEPHGVEWMAVMVYFGRPPRPYHDMEPAQRRADRSAGRQKNLSFEAPHSPTPPGGRSRR